MADRNFERGSEDRDSRGNEPHGFQFSDAYGVPGGPCGNRIVNDVHAKNATFNQFGFPDESQIFSPDQGGEMSGGQGQGDQAGQGQWEGRGGGRGHRHGHGGHRIEQQVDDNGQPLPGTVGATEMGLNALPASAYANNPAYYSTAPSMESASLMQPTQALDANGQPIPMQVLDANGRPIPQTVQALDANGQPGAQPAQSFDANQPIATPMQALSAAGNGSADPIISQITNMDPTMGSILTTLQPGMSQQGFNSMETLVAQNLANGVDDNTTLQSAIQQIQASNNPQDVQAFQQVMTALSPSTSTDSSSVGTSSDSSAPNAPGSSYGASAQYTPSSGYSTTTSGS